MKKLAKLFEVLGFVIQYLVPIFLFGDIIPFTTTKDVVKGCLTGMGYIAIALALFFVMKKVKEWVLQKPKSLKRAIVLSIPDILWWGAIYIGLDFTTDFMLKISRYWSGVIIFILLGRGCAMISEALSAEEGVKA